MTHEAAFLEAIRAEPDEDVHRLAYADWLSERGDPRGEFIRVQCQLARLPADDPGRAVLRQREQELLDVYLWDWTEGMFLAWLKHPRKACRNPRGHRFCELMARGIAAQRALDRLPNDDLGRSRLRRILTNTGRRMDDEFNYYPDTCAAPLFDECLFTRGFIHSATVQDFMVYLFGEALFELTLVRTLVIDDDALSELGDAVAYGLLRALPGSRLESLDLVTMLDTAAAVRDLVASKDLTSLESLDIFLPDDGDRAVEALAGSPNLRKLRRLGVSCQQTLTDTSLRAILDSPHLAGLQELTFDCEGPTFSPAMQQRYEARFRKS